MSDTRRLFHPKDRRTPEQRLEDKAEMGYVFRKVEDDHPDEIYEGEYGHMPNEGKSANERAIEVLTTGNKSHYLSEKALGYLRLIGVDEVLDDNNRIIGFQAEGNYRDATAEVLNTLIELTNLVKDKTIRYDDLQRAVQIAPIFISQDTELPGLHLGPENTYTD